VGDIMGLRWNAQVFSRGGLRDADDQSPRLDGLRAEVYRPDYQRLGGKATST
jgi:hypothetical protein